MGEFAKIYKPDLSDRQLSGFWDKMRECGRDRVFMYETGGMNDRDFCAWARNPDTKLWMILFRNYPCGLFALTKHLGKNAQGHFAMLPCGVRRTKNGLPVQIAYSFYSLAGALYQKNASGSYALDRVVGMTPACNTEALGLLHRLGGIECGRVPGACWYAETGENVDGIITMYTRDIIPAEAVNL